MSSKEVPPVTNKLADHPVSYGRRIFKIFCVAVAFYLFFLTSRTFFDLPCSKSSFIGRWPSGPREEDGRVLSCSNDSGSSQAHQTTFSLAHRTLFHLPASVFSKHFFVFSRGSRGHGTVKMELSDGLHDKIEIEATTYSIAGYKSVRVCHLERENGSQGIGIFTPRGIFQPLTTVDITIRFPKSPLVITSLETRLGIWKHDISLNDFITFKSLALSASNAAVHSESVFAEYVHIETGNGQIRGAYNVSDSLVLKTSNAAIVVNLRMENRDGTNPTHVNLKTSNARIDSPITLVSTNNESRPSPASFTVIATTSNSPINIGFPDAPSYPFPHLSLAAKTSNAIVNTKLHPTYEGSIYLAASPFVPPSIVQNPNPVDPSGKGRQRRLRIHKRVRGILEAGVWWGDDSDENKGMGTVVVTTSNAHNILFSN